MHLQWLVNAICLLRTHKRRPRMMLSIATKQKYENIEDWHFSSHSVKYLKYSLTKRALSTHCCLDVEAWMPKDCQHAVLREWADQLHARDYRKYECISSPFYMHLIKKTKTNRQQNISAIERVEKVLGHILFCYFLWVLKFYQNPLIPRVTALEDGAVCHFVS